MITSQIISLLSSEPMTSSQIVQKLAIKKEVINVTLNYLYNRKRISRENKPLAEKPRFGRTSMYVYSVNDNATAQSG